MRNSKTITSLEITDTTIENILDRIELRREPAMLRLIFDMLCSNPNAAKWFVDMSLGKPFPYDLVKGKEGFIKIDTLRWHKHNTEYESSGLVTQGYIPCIIGSFNGLHEYSPLTVILPVVQGVPDEDRHLGIRVEQFYTAMMHEDQIETAFELPF